jgi:hypothetical protein
MAAVTKGIAHLYGIAGTYSNATVISFSDSKSFNLEDETLDETGVGIEYRGDDRRSDASITLRAKSAFTEPALGTELTYDTVKFWITGVTKNEVQRGFREITLTLRNQEGITLT